MYRFPPNKGWPNGEIPAWYMRTYNEPKPPSSPIPRNIPIPTPDPSTPSEDLPSQTQHHISPTPIPRDIWSCTPSIQPQETSSRGVSPDNHPLAFLAPTDSSEDQLFHLLRDLTVQDLYNIARDHSVQSPTPSIAATSLVSLLLSQCESYPSATNIQTAPSVSQPGVLTSPSGSINCSPPTVTRVTPSWLTSESKFRSKATSAPYQEHYSGPARLIPSRNQQSYESTAPMEQAPIQPSPPIPPLPPPFAPPPLDAHYPVYFPLNPISRPSSQPSTSISDTISAISTDGLENVNWDAWGTPPDCWSALFDLDIPARGNLS
jgi:hypothetical protein